jgi:hypothetical protein
MSLLDDASLIVTPNAYKEGKLYSIIPTNSNGDFSVTRATTATRVNAAGLVELVPYNLVQYSEQFDNAAWVKTASSVTANTTTSPSGLTNADTLTANGILGFHQAAQLFTSVSGTTYTFSVYAKKNTNDFVQLVPSGAFGNLNLWANFDLNNGVVGSTGSSTTASIQSVGNGWYRCIITGVANASASYTFAVLLASSATAARGENNTLSTSVFIWGAQLVEGTSALDYQATETRLNIPRLDYSLGSCPNILLEPQRTNLALNSQSFFPSWSVNPGITTALVTPTTTIDPQGLTNAARVQNVAGDQVGRIFTIVSGTTYTNSWYIRRVSGTGPVRIADVNGINKDCALTSQWQRFETTAVATSTAGRCYVRVSTIGDIIEIWGAQLEAGAYATSYIPTTSASVTRNLDVVQATGVSSLIGQTEGTIYWEGTLTSGLDDLFALNRNTTNSLWLYKSSINTIVFRLYYGGVAASIGGATAYTGTIKLAAAYKSGNSVLYINGVQVGTSALAFAFTGALNDVVLNNTAFLFGNATKSVKTAALFPTRLTNAQLAALTA